MDGFANLNSRTEVYGVTRNGMKAVEKAAELSNKSYNYIYAAKKVKVF